MSLLPRMPRLGSRQAAQSSDYHLIKAEARIGGTLFGQLPKGMHREFFCLDEYTWVYHESQVVHGTEQSTTVRYEVRPQGVLKSQNGGHYQQLNATEAQNLREAVLLYQHKIAAYYQPVLSVA